MTYISYAVIPQGVCRSYYKLAYIGKLYRGARPG